MKCFDIRFPNMFCFPVKVFLVCQPQKTELLVKLKPSKIHYVSLSGISCDEK